MTKSNLHPEAKYNWWKDKKIFGLILCLVVISFQIFAFLEIPFLTTIHGYTVGMIFGFYNPLFYLFGIYFAIRLMTSNKFSLPKWLTFKASTYCLLVISILFISAASGYYQVKSGWLSFGSEPWSAFSKWFSDFTTKQNAWYPVNTNGGLIGVFLYSFFAMIFSGIGAFIIAILSILVPLSLIFTGSVWGLYRKIIKRRILVKRAKKSEINKQNPTADSKASNEFHTPTDSSGSLEVMITKPLDLSSENDDSSNVDLETNEDSDLETNESQTLSSQKNGDLPFDDPFN